MVEIKKKSAQFAPAPSILQMTGYMNRCSESPNRADNFRGVLILLDRMVKFVLGERMDPDFVLTEEIFIEHVCDSLTPFLHEIAKENWN